jgi:tRNA-dihydrouridine synthase B
MFWYFMTDLWNYIKKPILALAPLSGITDSAFRQVCKRFGADLVYSELASATAIVYSSEPTLEIISFNQLERPYIIQLFGSNPQHFAVATRLVTKQIRPDGIDINFGCPNKKVFNSGAGAALMTDLARAREVIQSVIDNTDLPVSIKTRIRVNKIDLLTFLDHVSDLDIKAIMIHGRTYAQRFSGPNDIETTRRARDHFGGTILANGGANNAVQALDLLEKTGADGIGLARGALGNPWIFQELKNRLNVNSDSESDRKDVFKTAMEHAQLSNSLKGWRGILEMRKHLCWYMKDVPGATKLRQRLVTVKSLEDISDILESAG